MITCEDLKCSHRACCQQFAKRLLEKVNELFLQEEIVEHHSKHKIHENLKELEKGLIHGHDFTECLG